MKRKKMEKLITEKEAAEMLSLAIQTLANWRHLRKGPPYYKMAPSKKGPIRYLESDIIKFIESKRIEFD